MPRLLDPALMQMLLAVSEDRNYTRAGERAGLTQQAISAQIKRLEAAVGRQLVMRTGQGIAMTADGEALLAYARQLAETSERVRRQFSAVPMTGHVRAGFLEGFATTGLPGVLAAIREVQPNLEIIVETASTSQLLSRLEQDRLDIVLGLQRKGEARGAVIQSAEMFWFGDPVPYADPDVPVRLATYPEPSLPRSLAIEALTAAGRHYVVAFESNSRSSLRAAGMVGLGIVPFCDLLHDGERPSSTSHLPPLPGVEFFLRIRRGGDEAVDTFANFMREFTLDLLERARAAINP